MKREEVVLADGGDRVVERRRVLGAEAAPSASSPGRSSKVSRWRSRGSDAALALDPRRLLRVLAEHADGLRVVEDVRGVVGRAVRVDGRRRRRRSGRARSRTATTRASSGRRSRTPRPSDPAREQAVGHVLDALRGLRPADLVPVVAVLDEVGGAVAVPRDGVLPEPCDRSFLSHGGNLLVRGAGTAKPGRMRSFPNRPRSSCARPGTDP